MSEASEANEAAPPAAAGMRTGLVPWEDFRAQNTHIFPSVESWRWFVRQHRECLAESGALCFVAGRIFVLPDLMTRAIVEIGQRLAKARAA